MIIKIIIANNINNMNENKIIYKKNLKRLDIGYRNQYIGECFKLSLKRSIRSEKIIRKNSPTKILINKLKKSPKLRFSLKCIMKDRIKPIKNQEYKNSGFKFTFLSSFIFIFCPA